MHAFAHSPGDAGEREADRLSERVVSWTEPQRRASLATDNRAESVTGTAPGYAPRSPGQPLDRATRDFMEPRFEHDFSHVRVHADSASAAKAEAVRARAFTIGQNIVFAAGQYQPASAEGRRLLAHELTHVVQQRQAGQSAQIMRKPPETEPKWPSGGIQVVGGDKDDLVKILNTCTGVPMSLDKKGMLVIANDKPKGQSTTAIDALRKQAANKSFGIIIDTDPAAEAVEVGAFDKDFPGYQSIDVANIKVMAAAGGAPGGIDACSAVLHEITEATAGRAGAMAGKLKGDKLFEAAHKTGVATEEKIRTEAKLPLRAQDQGSMQQLGWETTDKVLLLLDSTVFGSGKARRTQINVVRFILGTPKGGNVSGDSNVIASYVVEGEVKFSSQSEAIEVFNKYASKLGFKPIPVPKP